MASKFGLAGGIPERRVRPIWDAIDSRQFKNALKQSTTLLSKFPNSPYALVIFHFLFFSFSFLYCYSLWCVYIFMQVAMLDFIFKIAWSLWAMWIIFCVLITVYKFLLFWLTWEIIRLKLEPSNINFFARRAR